LIEAVEVSAEAHLRSVVPLHAVAYGDVLVAGRERRIVDENSIRFADLDDLLEAHQRRYHSIQR